MAHQHTDSFKQLWKDSKKIAEIAGVVLAALIAIPLIIATVVMVQMLIFGSKIVGWILNGITSAIGMLLSWMSQIGGFLLRAMSGAGSWLFNVGKDIIQGLIHGIESSAQRVFDTIKNIGGKAVSALKGVLKIFSPSQVFADIGQNIGAGLVQGIQGTEVNVTHATTKLGTAAVTGGNNAMNAVSSTTNNAISNNNSQTVHIAQVSLGSAGAVQEFFKSINQDAINTSRGLSPVQGSY